MQRDVKVKAHGEGMATVQSMGRVVNLQIEHEFLKGAGIAMSPDEAWELSQQLQAIATHVRSRVPDCMMCGEPATHVLTFLHLDENAHEQWQVSSLNGIGYATPSCDGCDTEMPQEMVALRGDIPSWR